MRIGEEPFSYEWIEHWAAIPDTPSGRANGRTHGVAVAADGSVLVFHQADPAVLRFDPDGRLMAAWGDRFPGAHGMTLARCDGDEHLWLTDEHTGEVVRTTLDGRTVQTLDRPDLPAYRDGRYSPTWVAVAGEGFGGDVWVADGYGMNYVHRYDRDGRYLGSLDGTEGEAGAFDCPHGLWIDARRGTPELCIADRGNRRIQVYDLDGRFVRAWGDDVFRLPCGGAVQGDVLYVPELCARLAVLDAEDRLVCYLGRNEAACDVPGWPDHAPERILPGRFNSPHAMAVAPDGSLFVVEWIVGGRITKLAR